MRTRIVVADQAEARFYDVRSPGKLLRASGRLSDPTARLPERAHVSDRPGRVYDRAPEAGRRRGATAHHDTGGERSARRFAAVSFARRIAQQLDKAQHQGRFDRIVLIASPRFLGMLRRVLPQQLAHCVVAEVPKDLVHQRAEVVSAHIPSTALR